MPNFVCVFRDLPNLASASSNFKPLYLPGILPLNLSVDQQICRTFLAKPALQKPDAEFTKPPQL
ncbi:hypothetical protein CAMRE0001_3089 [Campylobacter rectus RM3267]|uniref:Uncharacterized protein n=1 Tax=Campylobacter rectus RM3267 TaxID=553218 RepID=B9D4P4_CAMRE|nr:hypothetical protein CAMRE0001_3089 [Campylobacter rectus RM3267]